MTRSLKPQKVDEVASPGGHVRVDVFLDRNNLDFYVEPPGGGDKIRADDVHTVKKLAKDMLAKVVPYSWEGVILVEVKESWVEAARHNHHRFTHGTRVEFEYTRWDRSPHPTKPGHHVFRMHALDFAAKEPSDWETKRRERNEGLENVWTSEKDVVLPYDDATWEGLCALKRSIDAAHEQLEALVKRKDLASKLRLVGKQQVSVMPLLPEAGGRRG